MCNRRRLDSRGRRRSHLPRPHRDRCQPRRALARLGAVRIAADADADRRGVAPHRPARSEARSPAPVAGVGDRGIAPAAGAGRGRRRGRGRADRARPNAGVIVQRDAATILTTLDPEVAAKGVIFTDLATAFREHPELVERYFMTQAVPPSTSASSRRCTPPSGRAARSSTCRRVSPSSCRSASFA